MSQSLGSADGRRTDVFDIAHWTSRMEKICFLSRYSFEAPFTLTLSDTCRDSISLQTTIIRQIASASVLVKAQHAQNPRRYTISSIVHFPSSRPSSPYATSDHRETLCSRESHFICYNIPEIPRCQMLSGVESWPTTGGQTISEGRGGDP